jgi:hypothetical protein
MLAWTTPGLTARSSLPNKTDDGQGVPDIIRTCLYALLIVITHLQIIVACHLIFSFFLGVVVLPNYNVFKIVAPNLASTRCADPAL